MNSTYSQTGTFRIVALSECQWNVLVTQPIRAGTG